MHWSNNKVYASLSMVKKSLLWIYRCLFWLLSVTVITVAVIAFAIQFLVMPNIDQYKDKIATFASKAAQQKVVIGNIKAGWQGINPHLSLSDIDIFDAQNRPALQLKNTEVSLSWLSIPMFEPHLAELAIRAPELTIRRVAGGEIFVGGISMRGASKPDLPNWLLRQTKLEVIDAKVVWLDEMRGAPSLSLAKLNLEVLSPPWKSLIKGHSISLSTLPSIGTLNTIIISGNVYGNDVSHAEEWSGNLTLEVKNANIAAFKPWLDYPVDMQSGVGSTRLAVNFANRQLRAITSDVALDHVKMQLKANAEPILLNKLAGKLDWTNLSTGLSLNTGKPSTGQSFIVEHLTFSTNNGFKLQDLAATYTETAAESAQGYKALSLKIAHLSLANINPYLTQLPLPANMLQTITNLAPSGNLDKFALNWQGNQSATKTYQFSSKFSGLNLQAYEKIPGFNNLTGDIKANQSTGKLRLNTRNAKLDIKDALRWPIPADKLTGEIDWNIQDTNTNGKEAKIDVSKLAITSPHLSGVVDGYYIMDGNKGGYLDLKGKFESGDAKYALFYYPTILGKNTLHWLDTSILAGHARDINLTVKGRLADFPFVDSKNNINTKLGIFKVTAKVSDSIIEYGTGWPLVEGLGINLLFEGKRMELNATSGHVFGNQIVSSKSIIAQLDADDPILNIVSEIKGPVIDGIKFVNNSPVAELTQGFTDNLKTSGQGKLNLSLKIPLNDIERAQYKGVYLISNGMMESVDVPALSHINGLLEFTESSLTAKNIKATAFGAPVAFNLASGKDKIIHVNAKGKITDDVIKQFFITQNLVKGGNYISGNTDWLGDITIQKPTVNIAIRSDLFGLSSKLPLPFNKTINERLSLRIDKKQDATSDLIVVNIGNKVVAKVSRTLVNGKLQLDRAVIRLSSDKNSSAALNTSNPSPAELNTNNEIGKAKGLQIFGSLDYLDGDAWRNVMADFTEVSKQSSPLQIQKIALKINVLDIFDRRLNQLKISNISDKDGLRANIQSREISGDLQWQNQTNGKLIARLTNFTIPEASPNRTAVNVTDNVNDVNTTTEVIKLNQIYPALDITADSFEFDKKKIGSLELVAFPQDDNWSIQKFKLINPESILTADGVWNKWVHNPNTRLNLNWSIKDLGKTLKRFGHPDTIKGGEGELTGQLNWVGSPHEFDTIALNGNLQFEMRKGQILKVQPGVGRLLGLLSLQSLPRRLSLDFRDLFSNGFAFDKINATVKIDHGVLSSDNFAMGGPAADVTIKGETNLQKETQQLFVKVMPHISDSLSLAALAGGPLAGAIAFLAQKILKDPFNKIASTDYQIIGTWDNPQEVTSTKSNPESNKQSPLN